LLPNKTQHVEEHVLNLLVQVIALHRLQCAWCDSWLCSLCW